MAANAAIRETGADMLNRMTAKVNDSHEELLNTAAAAQQYVTEGQLDTAQRTLKLLRTKVKSHMNEIRDDLHHFHIEMCRNRSAVEVARSIQVQHLRQIIQKRENTIQELQAQLQLSVDMDIQEIEWQDEINNVSQDVPQPPPAAEPEQPIPPPGVEQVQMQIPPPGAEEQQIPLPAAEQPPPPAEEDMISGQDAAVMLGIN